MGLFDFLRNILNPPQSPESANPYSPAPPASVATPSSTTVKRPQPGRRVHTVNRLPYLKYSSSLVRTPIAREIVRGDQPPYKFARRWFEPNSWLDMSLDGDERWLDHYGLPSLHTPQALADWLEMPVGRVAWLVHRFSPNHKPKSVAEAHYHYSWVKKPDKTYRLIESPKHHLKAAQRKILREMLDLIPSHPAAHGFVKGRSIRTNAECHVGQHVILKFDLQNFYPSIGFNRIVAIFRSLGYSREAGIWLARLTTSAMPAVMDWPKDLWNTYYLSGYYHNYYGRHLPQGAPTSPALANLSAFALDVRLAGLARCYDMNYTRYADDLTFSGPAYVMPALGEVIKLTQRIIREERFTSHLWKRKVVRHGQRQVVTGVVVNEKTNISRRDYDRLKAILHNCKTKGPSTQNRGEHDDFAAHLRGRIAHVMHLNKAKGEKLLRAFDQIDWTK